MTAQTTGTTRDYPNWAWSRRMRAAHSIPPVSVPPSLVLPANPRRSRAGRWLAGSGRMVFSETFAVLVVKRV